MRSTCSARQDHIAVPPFCRSQTRFRCSGHHRRPCLPVLRLRAWGVGFGAQGRHASFTTGHWDSVCASRASKNMAICIEGFHLIGFVHMRCPHVPALLNYALKISDSLPDPSSIILGICATTTKTWTKTTSCATSLPAAANPVFCGSVLQPAGESLTSLCGPNKPSFDV